MGTYHLVFDKGGLEIYSKPSLTKCQLDYVSFTETEVIEFYGAPCNVELRRPVGRSK
jgi:hypothetical protein